MPVVTGVVLLANSVLIRRLPRTPHATTPAPARAPAAPSPLRLAAKDVGFAVLSLVNGVFGVNGVLLMTVLPLWLVGHTSAPPALTAWLFGLNTVLAVGFQVRATRSADTLPGSIRLLRLAGLAIAAACVCAYAAGQVSPLGAAVLMTAAIAVNTGAELWSSAASWFLLAELTRPARGGHTAGCGASGCRRNRLSVPLGSPGWS